MQTRLRKPGLIRADIARAKLLVLVRERKAGCFPPLMVFSYEALLGATQSDASINFEWHRLPDVFALVCGGWDQRGKALTCIAAPCRVTWRLPRL